MTDCLLCKTVPSPNIRSPQSRTVCLATSSSVLFFVTFFVCIGFLGFALDHGHPSAGNTLFLALGKPPLKVQDEQEAMNQKTRCEKEPNSRILRKLKNDKRNVLASFNADDTSPRSG